MRMRKGIVTGLLLVFFFAIAGAVSVPVAKGAAAPQEETIAGTVIKTDKGIIIEAEDGDYLVKGQDLSKMIGKMVEATGIIKESDKGDIIEVKTFEEIQE
jgi:hypothetical protein